MRKYFGTDGIRGKVGDHPVTPEFVMKLGWAAGRVLAGRGKGPVLIGKDTRISGYMFESALEAGLSAAGVDIRLLGPMPTPAIAYLTRNTRAQAGIVISASHNPYQDNGIKFFSSDGFKLPDDVELAIEEEMDKPLTLSGGRLGKAQRMSDAPRRYIEFCKSRLADCRLDDLHLVIDCANGAGYRVAGKVFQELGAKVDMIGAEPDGININEQVGATSPELLCKTVVEKGADAGLALDGDGDRLIMVDDRGTVIDGDEILYMIAKSRQDSINGAVVGTQMSNLGLEQAILAMQMKFHRVKVGDRYIMEMLTREDLRLGGESSGHIINLNLCCAGDGIVSGLQVLAAMVSSQQSLRELMQGMNKYPQILHNIRTPERVDMSAYPELDDVVREAEHELGQRGRVLLRPSGTEPLLRIMVEGEDESQVSALVQHLVKRVETLLQKQI
ncbi:MAG: phosphoglucosamine mutase [Gammaproteobacteria bacterium]